MSKRLFGATGSMDGLHGGGDRLWGFSDAQSDFVSMATHQIKTPLSGIKWTLNMLLRGDGGKISDEQRKWLQSSFDANERVLQLINEILESIRIDEDRFVLDKKQEDLVELFDDVIKRLKPLISKKKTSIKIDIFPKNEAVFSLVDRVKMQVAIENLLANSIQYTREGGHIYVSIIKESGDIKVSIRDDGIGVPESEKKDIFARFFRASNAVKRLEQGSGLGLFITQGIIEKHGGKIWFESNEDRGTTFYFIIPMS